METIHHVNVRLARKFEFVAEFPDMADAASILFDEPEPIGDSRAPGATAVLGAAVGNCLAASLLFCLRKVRLDPDGLTAHVATHVTRNERGRFRISRIDVELVPEVKADSDGRFARCESIFEDFCTVTPSIRQGIPVNVSVVRRETVDAHS